MILEARHLSFAYHAEPVLRDVSVALHPGVTAIVGPNAAGKSTLLRCLCGLLRPQGEVLLDGRPLARVEPAERTRAISYLPQNLATRAALTVFETVLLGRVNQLRWRVGEEDAARVQALLEEFDLAALGARPITELSGGQLQLVAVAQALAREPTVLLLDEPNTSLDLRHQFDLCARIRDLTAARGLSTALSVHDINMAARIADTVYVLEAGRVCCSGSPRDVLTAERIASVYHVAARVTLCDDGRPLVTPIGPAPRLDGTPVAAARSPLP